MRYKLYVDVNIQTNKAAEGVPQEGRFNFNAGGELHVTTIPFSETSYGREELPLIFRGAIRKSCIIWVVSMAGYFQNTARSQGLRITIMPTNHWQ